MSATARERTLMVLCLIAVMVFAANLISFVENQFFGHDRHQGMADQMVQYDHEVVIAPHAPFPPHARFPAQHVFEIRRLAELEALTEVEVRLNDEAARLAEESARLAADGHADAAASLEEAVQQMREKLDTIRERQLEGKVEAPSPADQAALEAVLAAPSPVFETERIRVGNTEISVVVKS